MVTAYAVIAILVAVWTWFFAAAKCIRSGDGMLMAVVLTVGLGTTMAVVLGALWPLTVIACLVYVGVRD